MAYTQIVGGIGGQYDLVFDATAAYTIKFTYNGNQVTKNRLLVKNNYTNATVFDDTVTSMAKTHVIPADTLENGVTYNLAIQVYYINASGQEVSDTLSDTALLRCLSAPVIVFNDFSLVVRNATYDFSLSYSQAENDLIDSYRVILYDDGGHVIYSKLDTYPASSTGTYQFVATISNLFDKHSYGIECIVTSVAGMSASTGVQEFSVEYTKPQSYSIVYADNAESQCAVRISSNIKLIEGYTSSGDDPTYIDNEKIDLSNSDTVIWDGLLNVYPTQIMVVFNAFVPYQEIVHIANQYNSLTVKTMQGKLYGETTEKAYVELFVNNGIGNYVVISNLIDVPDANDNVLLSIWNSGYAYSITLTKEV